MQGLKKKDQIHQTQAPADKTTQTTSHSKKRIKKKQEVAESILAASWNSMYQDPLIIQTWEYTSQKNK